MDENRCSYLPLCWSDDTRMQALFSPFRKRDLNPTGWQEKMDFWIKAIKDFCGQTNQGVVSCDIIRQAFKKDNRYPNCINEVLTYMQSQGLLQTTDEFSSLQSSSWISWGFDLAVKKPLSWGYSFVKDMVFEKQPSNSKFILPEVITAMADKIAYRYLNLIEHMEADSVTDIDIFKSKCSDICEGENFQYALIQLQKDKKVVLISEAGTQYIKFRKNDQDNEIQLSDIDKAVIKLGKTSEVFSKEIKMIEKDIEECTIAAKDLVRKGNKSKAMVMLKKRKRLENDLNKKLDSIYNMETLQFQLRNTASGKQVFDAFNVGVAAMKSRLSDMNIDKVDETMADLEEAMDDVAEVEKTLTKGIHHDFDEDGLEEELNDILSASFELPETPLTSTIGEKDNELEKRLEALMMPSSGFDISPKSDKDANVSRITALI